jgi:GxxExxY protein
MIKINEISGAIVDAAYHLHARLGPGLLESVYEELLAYELNKRGLRYERQKPIPIEYDGRLLELGFRADLVVEDAVIIELKSVETLAPVHKKQLLTYLKVLGKQLGLLINFGAPLIKNSIERIANGVVEESPALGGSARE